MTRGQMQSKRQKPEGRNEGWPAFLPRRILAQLCPQLLERCTLVKRCKRNLAPASVGAEPAKAGADHQRAVGQFSGELAGHAACVETVCVLYVEQREGGQEASGGGRAAPRRQFQSVPQNGEEIRGAAGIAGVERQPHISAGKAR